MEHTALIYTMLLMSAADSKMTDSELLAIGDLVRTLPVFRGFDPDLLPKSAEDCANILAQEGGMDTVIDLIKDSLANPLRETAYALACDIAAADGTVGQEEARLLELLRHRLEIERLVAASIERGAKARYQTID